MANPLFNALGGGMPAMPNPMGQFGQMMQQFQQFRANFQGDPKAEVQKLLQSGKMIEERAYHTVHGVWRYFTVEDGQIQLDSQSYIMIGTLESYQNMKKYFGEEKLLPVLIELDDGIRLQRALDRERQQEHPKYEEMCRRYLADSDDFSEEKIAEAGISRRFYNDDLQRCLGEIVEYIKENLEK